MNIAIIGDGNVGSAFRRGLQEGGHAVEAVGNEPERVRALAASAEVVVLAVPFGAVGDVAGPLGDAVDGKVLVDVTNALGEEMQLTLGFTTSGAEELQRRAPRARVVKAFNTVLAGNMDAGRVSGEQLTALVAGDETDAKGAVLGLARDLGFDPVYAGPLRNARYLEPLGILNIQLGYGFGMGTEVGFRLVH